MTPKGGQNSFLQVKVVMRPTSITKTSSNGEKNSFNDSVQEQETQKAFRSCNAPLTSPNEGSNRGQIGVKV